MRNLCFTGLKRAAGVLSYLFLLLITNLAHGQIDFTKSELDFNGFGSAPMVTSLTFGPDGRLYVLEYPGAIHALTVQRNSATSYVVTARETITAVQNIPNHDDDGTACSGFPANCSSREATGLAVAGTASNPILYVTSSDFRIGAGLGGGKGDVDLDTNSGVITRLNWTGSSWEVVDLVRGLPRSEENHATNGLEFTTINGKDYLIVAQGGNTNGGSPSINFTLICEYALSAAVLAIDLTQLESMPILNDNGRNYIYDLPTLDDPTRPNINGITDPDDPSYNGVDVNDPWGGNDGLNQAMIVPGGPVQIFSPGFRNPYDLVVTESGAVYTTDNGANGGWGGIPINEGGGSVTNNYDTNETGGNSASQAPDGEFMNNVDHLQLITTNKEAYTFGSFYGGHPNPTRANPNGAGLYTAPASIGTAGAVFRTQKFDPDGSGSGSTSDPNVALPANWPPVSSVNAVEGDWRGPGVSNPDGPDDNPVTTWQTNTNGIDEYTASNFGGAMKGNLLAGTSGGQLRRVELEADGTLKQMTPNFLIDIGGNALGISCNSDDEIFPGTIWAGTLNSKIVVFEPKETQGPTFPLRINAGGPEVSYNGEVFEEDVYFQDGQAFSNNSAAVVDLFKTERTSPQKTFNYSIPASNGDYTVILHFAEIYWGATGGGPGGVGSRIFDVSIEGVVVLDDYDIVADVGSETAVEKSFEVTVTDGQLNLNFSSLVAVGGEDQPKVSAIEVLAIENLPPVAIAEASPLTGTIPLNVSFTGENSTDDVAVVSYLWDFKDGSPTSSEMNPTHIFTTAGVYEVQLTVEDEKGLSNSTTISITATDPSNAAPTAVIDATPESGTVPLEVTFSAENSTDDVEVVSYLWDFGDGTTNSSEMNPTHRFENAGSFEVSLTVEDAQGLSDTKTILIVVLEPAGEGEYETGAWLLANPAKDLAQVRIIDESTELRRVLKIYMYDSAGRLLAAYDPKDVVANGLYEIPISMLSSSEIYYLVFEMDKGDRTVLSLIANN
ncbi:MAG: PKD domain-containing protein [Flavobacteriaceae bacterium]